MELKCRKFLFKSFQVYYTTKINRVMCLSVPGKVISLDGSCAKVQIGEITCEVCTKLVEDVKIGDYLLIHTGFAIEKLSEENAVEILKILNEIFCLGST